MGESLGIGTEGASGSWLNDPAHRAFLEADARRQLAFFRASLRRDGGLDILDWDGTPLPRGPQELHITTRIVHSYVLGKTIGAPDSAAMIDAGMAALWTRHRDRQHGGYVWSFGPEGPVADDKLAYGHVFVLLAGASAKTAGHPDADRLIADVSQVLEDRFWDEAHGLFRDEFRRDWTPFSTYRGMNANMHGVEALLSAYEATGDSIYRDRAGRILDFFVKRIAPAHGDRLPEHYTEAWEVDASYTDGNPMFRPAGTTPGHSFEIARLALQYWDLCGREDDALKAGARALIEQALRDAWREDGGIVYTLKPGGGTGIADRYWWPVAEAIAALAALLKVDAQPADEEWYRRLWRFAAEHFVDAERGGWYPEVDDAGHPTATQFHGKPDIYHALQADLIPLLPGISRPLEELRALSLR
jgi:mannose/cellobiose epimerase-like protein (N-acyl-D-glucosamine 2-epimerase family)